MDCPHCHSDIPSSSLTCPDCGATLRVDGGKDDGIYPELAQANLLRLRGDTSAAENHLISLLKRYPNNASAHEMLGDIHMDAGDMVQAAQWYELALDLAPDTPGLSEKMLRAKNSIVKSEQQAAVVELGLQSPASNRLLAIAMVAVVILAVAILGLLAIMNRNANPPIIRSIVSAPPEITFIGNPSPTPSPVSANRTGPSATANPAIVQDQAALSFLTEHAADGSRLLTLTTDPRGELIAMTFAVREGEDPKPFAARLAKAALDQYPDCGTVTVRASLDGKLVYVADAPRSRLQETLAPAWQQANTGEGAWISYLLTNEWPTSSASSPSATSSPSASATAPGSIVPVSPP